MSSPRSRAINITPTQALASEFTCTSVSFVFVVLRLYVRVHTRFSAPSTNPWYQDVIITLAWLCSLGNAIVDTFANKNGMWNANISFNMDDSNPPIEKYITDPTILLRELKILYYTEPLYFLAAFFVKMSFLLMYRHLFPPNMKRLRMAMYGVMGLVVVGYALILGLSMFWCVPIKKNWALKMEDRCLAWGAAPPYLFATGVNILSDLAIYSLPFFLLPTLYRSSTTRQFIGVIICFSLGLFCIICTTCRIIIVGSGAPIPYIAAWLAAEMATGIIAACAPPLRWFWTNKVHRHIEKHKESPVMVPQRKVLWSGSGGASTSKISWAFPRSWRGYRTRRNSGEYLTGTMIATRKDERTIGSTGMSMTRSGTMMSTAGNESIVVNGLVPRHNGQPRVERSISPGKGASRVEEIAVIEPGPVPPHELESVNAFMSSDARDTMGSSVPIVRESSTTSTNRSKSWRKWKKQRKEHSQRKVELGNLTFGGVNQPPQMMTISEREEIVPNSVIRSPGRGGAGTSQAGFGFLQGQSIIGDDDRTSMHAPISKNERRIVITRNSNDRDSFGESNIERDPDAKNSSHLSRDSHSFFVDSEVGSVGPKSTSHEGDLIKSSEPTENPHRISFISDAFGGPR